MRGRVLALQAIVLIGTTPIGGPILGWVSDMFGARVGIVLGGIAALAAASWGLFAARRVHRSVHEDAGAVVPDGLAMANVAADEPDAPAA